MESAASQPGLPIELPQKTVKLMANQANSMRIKRPVRNQIEMMLRDLDSLIADDHPVRSIWACLQKLDLSAFYASIKTALDTPGRPASDPQVLLAVWLYATAEGIGSARHLEKLCKEHDAYRWLCGNVPVDYHLLSEFRVAHQEALDNLLTNILATLMKQKLLTLKQVAQDGTRVRASAGAGSFHRKNRLERCILEAEAQVKQLKEERDHSDPRTNVREQAARERAAKERLLRIHAALEELPLVEAAKERQRRTKSRAERRKITETRVSTTDPEARIMKMPDGGYRPAFNVQLATDVKTGVIVGAAVVNQGSDSGQAEPMETQVTSRSGTPPEEYLFDGGFAQRESITSLTKQGIVVYAPVKEPRSKNKERVNVRWGDTPEVIQWRQRMETEESKQIYRLRAATAEWANAQMCCHGLSRFTVRGISKVLNVVLLATITHNILRWLALTP